MTYTLTNDPGTIRRDSDGAFIPTDPNNRDYVAYMVWLLQGNHPTIPDGVDPPTPPADPDPPADPTPPSTAPGI
jgi:hypothetical protein